MKNCASYYSEFEQALERANLSLATEFKKYSSTHTPREVFLWLEELRINDKLPKELNDILTNFYWEIL